MPYSFSPSVRASWLFLITWIAFGTTSAQVPGKVTDGIVEDTLNATRSWIAASSIGLTYATSMILLDQAWYAQQPRTRFHFFNDWKEWRGVDKAGHLFSNYATSYHTYRLARWTGKSESASIWWGIGTGIFFQSSLEFLDGFAQKWGFSWYDMIFNVAGATTFAVQQKAWGEQRIWIKMNSVPRRYPNTNIAASHRERYTLQDRSNDLFGNSWAERILKDYNAQVIWASLSPKSFFSESNWPEWLNVAFGFGAENLYAGFGYSFTNPNNQLTIDLDPAIYPRYNEYLLSLDIDFARIPTRKKWVRTLLSLLNTIKVPAPSIAYQSLGNWQWYWFR